MIRRHFSRRTPKSKKVLRIHARRRAYQRFGVLLTTDAIERIAKDIRNGRAKFFDRQSNTVTRWIVKLADKEVAVVYDKPRKTIRTVMPVEYLTKERP